MPEVKDHKDAEREATRYIQDKFSKSEGTRLIPLKFVIFKKIWREGDVWMIDGVIDVKSGLTRSTKKPFTLQLHSESGEVIGYKEG